MKKKRLISLIAAFSLVFTGVTAYVPSGVYAEENVQMENLVQGKAAIASSTANGYGPEYAVDGSYLRNSSVEFCRYEELGSCIREQQGF